MPILAEKLGSAPVIVETVTQRLAGSAEVRCNPAGLLCRAPVWRVAVIVRIAGFALGTQLAGAFYSADHVIFTNPGAVARIIQFSARTGASNAIEPFRTGPVGVIIPARVTGATFFHT